MIPTTEQSSQVGTSTRSLKFKKEKTMKYAIQLMFEGKTLFITEGFGTEPKTFDSREAAEDASAVYPNSKVVEYRVGN
jgi:hypothetical protein